MHELALAQDVVQIVCEEAEQNGLARVHRLSIEVGQLRGVIPEVLRNCLEFTTKGTVAEGAAVDLRVVPGRASCPDCGLEYEVPDLFIVCPRCERIGAEVLAGEELRLVELEGD